MDKIEDEELKKLNKTVERAIKDRKLWLDKKMVKYAKFKIGDEIFNIQTGECVGIVRRLFRFWEDRDEGVRDTSLEIHYEYCTGGMCYDNTSRQCHVRFGSREDMKKSLQARMDIL